MGLFNQTAKMPISKEIGINTTAEKTSLLAALKAAGVKAKDRGDVITIKSKFLDPVSFTGTLTDAGGEWTGSIIMTGQAGAVAARYSNISANLKKFTKAK